VIYIAAAVLLFATGWVLDRLAQFGNTDRIYKINKISIHSVNPVNPVNPV
jgi:cytochrome b subunit of formate dehydrogenase